MLTVAHMWSPVEAGDHSYKNLRALCQRCHLSWDRAHHIEKARAKREKRSCQIPLFTGEPR